MLSAKLSWMKRVGKRTLRIALSLLLILQMVWVPNAAHAAETIFYFRGYNVENINSSTLNYATNSATVGGTGVTFAELSSEGEAFLSIKGTDRQAGRQASDRRRVLRLQGRKTAEQEDARQYDRRHHARAGSAPRVDSG